MTENTSSHLNPDEEPSDPEIFEHSETAGEVCKHTADQHTAYQRAVESIFADHKAEARLSAQKAIHIHAARVAHAEEYPEDRSSGGPKWTSEVIAQRELVTELSAGLRISENTARNLIFVSKGLVEEFPTTLAALGTASISYRHAVTIVEQGSCLPDATRAAFEADMLAIAETSTVAKLTKKARTAVDTAEPEKMSERHLHAALMRSVYVEATADGMAYLGLHVPAVEAMAIDGRATAIAAALKNAGDPRTLAQLRVDVMCDLLINGEPSIPGAPRGILAHISLTVPVLGLLGVTDELTDLVGFGPIDPLTAARITAGAPSLSRVLTDPITGQALTYGRTRYKPGKDLHDLVELIWSECNFPGCSTVSTSCDLDHTIAWCDGGETSLDNLGPACPKHHKVKHRTDWLLERDANLVATWTSPAGHEYIIEPEPIARPAPRFGVESEWRQTHAQTEWALEPPPF